MTSPEAAARKSTTLGSVPLLAAKPRVNSDEPASRRASGRGVHPVDEPVDDLDEPDAATGDDKGDGHVHPYSNHYQSPQDRSRDTHAPDARRQRASWPGTQPTPEWAVKVAPAIRRNVRLCRDRFVWNEVASAAGGWRLSAVADGEPVSGYVRWPMASR